MRVPRNWWAWPRLERSPPYSREKRPRSKRCFFPPEIQQRVLGRLIERRPSCIWRWHRWEDLKRERPRGENTSNTLLFSVGSFSAKWKKMRNAMLTWKMFRSFVHLREGGAGGKLSMAPTAGVDGRFEWMRIIYSVWLMTVSLKS